MLFTVDLVFTMLLSTSPWGYFFSLWGLMEVLSILPGRFTVSYNHTFLRRAQTHDHLAGFTKSRLLVQLMPTVCLMINGMGRVPLDCRAHLSVLHKVRSRTRGDLATPIHS